MGACHNHGLSRHTNQEGRRAVANSSARLPSPNHARFVVLKQGHAGSLWLHSLLNSQPGVLSFFEFDGCDKGSGGGGGGGDGDGGDA